MRKPHIGIVSLQLDVHALNVQRTVEEHGARCYLIGSDRLSGSRALSWYCSAAKVRSAIEIQSRSQQVDPAQLDVIWWRRSNHPQRLSADLRPAERDLVERDCSAALLGCLLTTFRGVWVNDPLATMRAENKLVQLEHARAAGLRIPETLVSQDPRAIRAFCRRRVVVVKPVRGTVQRQLLSQRVMPSHLKSARSLRVCPAIYQECIPGTTHLRVHCFGEKVIVVEIESHDLDWRRVLDVPFRVGHMSRSEERQVLQVLRGLGLRMGIVDLKRGSSGALVWLEVNPQGQFLFAEGLSGVGLTDALVEFLLAEAVKRRRQDGTARVRK